jgi:hypothetical protein
MRAIVANNVVFLPIQRKNVVPELLARYQKTSAHNQQCRKTLRCACGTRYNLPSASTAQISKSVRSRIPAIYLAMNDPSITYGEKAPTTARYRIAQQ